MVTKAEIQMVRSLADKKGRAEHGLFVAEGPKMVTEALTSRLRVRRVFGTEEYADAPGCEVVGRKDLERMSALKTPQGVMALVEIPRRDTPPQTAGGLILALDGVQDPGNMGTILRTADWFGIRTVVCSEDSADCFNPKVVQASMGAVFRVAVHYTALEVVLAQAAGDGTPVYGAFLDGENVYTADLGAAPTGIIVMGNEGNGIRRDIAATVTRRLYIPPYPAGRPSSESLNVATATAILCSEFRRRG